MPKLARFFSEDSVGLFLVYLTVFIDMLGQSIVTPIMPFYAKEFGATAQEVGLIMTIFALCQLISVTVSGRISDKIGRRPVLLTFLAGSCVFFFLQGIAWNLDSFIAFRGLAGLFGGSPPIAQAYVADSVDPDSRPKYLALVGSTIGMAFMFGPAIGSGLAQFSLDVPMYVSSVTSLVAFIVAIFLLPETNPAVLAAKKQKENQRVAAIPVLDENDEIEQKDGRGAADASIQMSSVNDINPRGEGSVVSNDGLMSMESLTFSEHRISLHPDEVDEEEDDDAPLDYFGISVVCTVSFLNMMAFQGFQSMFALYTEAKFELDSLAIGFVFTGVSVVFITVQIVLFNVLLVSIGLASTVLIGSAALGVSMGTMPLPDTMGGTFACALVMGAGYSLVMPAIPVALSAIAPVSRQGSIISLGEAAAAFARVIGPSMYGFLFEVNMDYTFFAAGGFGALCCLVVTFVICYKRRLPYQPPKVPGIYVQREKDEFASRDQLRELGEYLGQLLSVRHYRWVSHIDELKILLGKAFPPLRPDEDDLKDDINVVVDRLSKIAMYLKTD